MKMWDATAIFRLDGTVPMWHLKQELAVYLKVEEADEAAGTIRVSTVRAVNCYGSPLEAADEAWRRMPYPRGCRSKAILSVTRLIDGEVFEMKPPGYSPDA